MILLAKFAKALLYSNFNFISTCFSRCKHHVIDMDI